MRYLILGLVLATFLPAAPASAKPVVHKSSLRVYGRNKVPHKVTATVLPEHVGEGTDPNDAMQQLASRVGCSEKDQAGHAIPRVLGGRGVKGNIYPLLARENNKLGKWEEKLAKKLTNKECLSIEYEVRLTYGDRQLKLRPTRVEITAKCNKPDGDSDTLTYKTDNPKPAECEKKVFPDADDDPEDRD